MEAEKKERKNPQDTIPLCQVSGRQGETDQEREEGRRNVRRGGGGVGASEKLVKFEHAEMVTTGEGATR